MKKTQQAAPPANKAAAPDTVKINKSKWIRSQPDSLNARAVVEKAKAAGIKLSIAQVYTTRSLAKRRPKGRAGRPAEADRATAAQQPPKTRGRRGAENMPAGGDDDHMFRRLLASVGLTRAQAYLDDFKRRLGL